jgi:hypothetical protein
MQYIKIKETLYWITFQYFKYLDIYIFSIFIIYNSAADVVSEGVGKTEYSFFILKKHVFSFNSLALV